MTTAQYQFVVSTIRYDTVRYCVFNACSKKLTDSQLSLPHGTVTNGGVACRARGEGQIVCVCGCDVCVKVFVCDIARLGLNAWMRERGSGKVSMRVNWR